MIEGAAVKAYFETYPEKAARLEGIMYQFKLPGDDPEEETHRPLSVDDIKYITFEDMNGKPGTYAWYYPVGVPHYTCID